eukprot:438341-Amorphochlora_amoeboformis.AAC.1
MPGIPSPSDKLDRIDGFFADPRKKTKIRKITPKTDCRMTGIYLIAVSHALARATDKFNGLCTTRARDVSVER